MLPPSPTDPTLPCTALVAATVANGCMPVRGTEEHCRAGAILASVGRTWEQYQSAVIDRMVECHREREAATACGAGTYTPGRSSPDAGLEADTGVGLNPPARALDPGTPPDGYSGAPAPGPCVAFGLALPFEQWSRVHMLSIPAGTTPRKAQTYVRRGAYTECLSLVAAGRHVVRLCVEHDERRALLSTEDGSLRLFQAERGLYIGMFGPRAADVPALNRTLPQLSAGGSPAGPLESDAYSACGTVRQMVVAKEWLVEVSLVPHGSYPTNTIWMPVGR